MYQYFLAIILFANSCFVLSQEADNKSNENDLGIERYGFEVELSKDQLKKIIHIFDWEGLIGVQKEYIVRMAHLKDVDRYLDEPSNFHELSTEMRKRIINLLPKKGLAKELIPYLEGEGQRWYELDDLSKKRRLKIAYDKVKNIWKKKISLLDKKNNIRVEKLPKEYLASLLIFYLEGKVRLRPDFKDLPGVNGKIVKLFEHLEYFKDQSALEFRLRDDYIVNDKEKFLQDFETFVDFAGVRELSEKPARRISESLSFHIHVSGPGVTDDYLLAWRFKILLDFLDQGFRNELFRSFGDASSLLDRGFVRRVSSDRGEIRNMSVSPREGLKLSFDNIVEELTIKLSTRLSKYKEALDKIAEEDQGAVIAFTDLFKIFHEWEDRDRLGGRKNPFQIKSLVENLKSGRSNNHEVSRLRFVADKIGTKDTLELLRIFLNKVSQRNYELQTIYLGEILEVCSLKEKEMREMILSFLEGIPDDNTFLTHLRQVDKLAVIIDILGPPFSQEERRRLVDLLDHPSNNVANQAFRSLYREKDSNKNLLKKNILKFLKSKNFKVQIGIIRSLNLNKHNGLANDPDVKSLVIEKLDSHNVELSNAAFKFISNRSLFFKTKEKEKYRDKCIQLLGNRYLHVRESAFSYLMSTNLDKKNIALVSKILASSNTSYKENSYHPLLAWLARSREVDWREKDINDVVRIALENKGELSSAFVLKRLIYQFDRQVLIHFDVFEKYLIEAMSRSPFEDVVKLIDMFGGEVLEYDKHKKYRIEFSEELQLKMLLLLKSWPVEKILDLRGILEKILDRENPKINTALNNLFVNGSSHVKVIVFSLFLEKDQNKSKNLSLFIKNMRATGPVSSNDFWNGLLKIKKISEDNTRSLIRMLKDVRLRSSALKILSIDGLSARSLKQILKKVLKFDSEKSYDVDILIKILASNSKGQRLIKKNIAKLMKVKSIVKSKSSLEKIFGLYREIDFKQDAKLAMHIAEASIKYSSRESLRFLAQHPSARTREVNNYFLNFVDHEEMSEDIGKFFIDGGDLPEDVVKKYFEMLESENENKIVQGLKFFSQMPETNLEIQRKIIRLLKSPRLKHELFEKIRTYFRTHNAVEEIFRSIESYIRDRKRKTYLYSMSLLASFPAYQIEKCISQKLMDDIVRSSNSSSRGTLLETLKVILKIRKAREMFLRSVKKIKDPSKIFMRNLYYLLKVSYSDADYEDSQEMRKIFMDYVLGVQDYGKSPSRLLVVDRLITRFVGKEKKGIERNLNIRSTIERLLDKNKLNGEKEIVDFQIALKLMNNSGTNWNGIGLAFKLLNVLRHIKIEQLGGHSSDTPGRVYPEEVTRAIFDKNLKAGSRRGFISLLFERPLLAKTLLRVFYVSGQRLELKKTDIVYIVEKYFKKNVSEDKKEVFRTIYDLSSEEQKVYLKKLMEKRNRYELMSCFGF